jgi:hypothetical protein
MPIGWALGIWGLSFFGGVVLLATTLTRLLRAQGRAWSPDRPASGIAGKVWGVLVPGIVLPPALVFALVFLSLALFHGGHVFMVSIALLICALLAHAYLRSVRKRSLQRRRVLQRDDNDEYLVLTNKVNDDAAAVSGSLEALESIAAVLHVPAVKLRPSDRFGYDIGTFSLLDDSIDRIGGQLLMRKRAFQQPLFLDHITTVGDYVREWNMHSDGPHSRIR